METSIEIPFDTDRTAEIAYHSLRVDPEPKRSGSKKELILDGKILRVDFFLRGSSNYARKCWQLSGPTCTGD